MFLFTSNFSYINYAVYEILKVVLIVMWGYVGFREVLYFVWIDPLTLAMMTMRGLTFHPCALIAFING